MALQYDQLLFRSIFFFVFLSIYLPLFPSSVVLIKCRSINSRSNGSPDSSCFLAAWAMSKFVLVNKHNKPKPNLQKRKISYRYRCSARVCYWQTSFSGHSNAWKKAFQSPLPTSFKDPLFFS